MPLDVSAQTTHANPGEPRFMGPPPPPLLPRLAVGLGCMEKTLTGGGVVIADTVSIGMWLLDVVAADDALCD